jgi:signal transduction histidine kinase/CheY-like chemotaxis protein
LKRVLYVQPVRRERDLVLARKQTRKVAQLLGFDGQWQTRLATAVSEIVRNAVRYAQGGDLEFSADLEKPQTLWMKVTDDGPGIPNLDDVLMGRYQSTTGMGMGLAGTKRLVAEFHIETVPGRGTEVLLGQMLPRSGAPLTADDLARIARSLLEAIEDDPFEEIQRQNRELLATLDELRRRQAELDRLNAELEDTNRGVMALYAELDDKAESLRQASEAKSRFLSNMTHEFRTPLNSILSLTGMLLDRVDGELTPEQDRQVTYVRKSAEDLSVLVNDLLDLAKIEAGKVDVRPAELEVSSLFGALKGVLRPLLASSSVALHFDEPNAVPTLYTDEGKLSQILRNFISNALKYTSEGEVRVGVAHSETGETVTFSVRDTGIGIATENQARVFEEFEQIAGPHQKRIKGTGLGLALSRKLAECLGGAVDLESEVGVGSTFSVTIPIRFKEEELPFTTRIAEDSGKESITSGAASADVERSSRSRILIVDDDEISRYLLEEILTGFGLDVLKAASGPEGIRLACEQRPDAIFLDLVMPELSGEATLEALAETDEVRTTPVIIYTSETLDDVRHARLSKRVTAVVAKQAPSREAAIFNVREALVRAGVVIVWSGKGAGVG